MRFSASRSLSATVPATETLASSAAFWASSVARSVASVPEAQALKTLRLMSLALSITFDDGSLWAFGSAMPRFSFPYGGGFDDRDPPEDSSSSCVNETLTGCRPRGTVTRSPLSRGGSAGDTTRHHFSGTAVVVSEDTGGLNVGRQNAVSVVMTAATVATPGMAHAAGRVCSRLLSPFHMDRSRDGWLRRPQAHQASNAGSRRSRPALQNLSSHMCVSAYPRFIASAS